MENKEQFGKLIIWLRERDGLSQKNLAEKLYVVPSTVCKWEKGRSVPDGEKLKLISELFQIPYEDLLDSEKTLAKLKSAPILPELELEPKQKRKRHWWICIAAVVIVIIICIAGMILNAYNHSDEWKIVDIYEQYIDDPFYGRVYEVSYVVNIYPELEEMYEYELNHVLSYVQQLELDADIVKISYYDNEDALESGDDPGRCSYYFLSNYEDD